MLPAHFQVFASYAVDLMQRRAPVLLVPPPQAQSRARLMPCCVQAKILLEIQTSVSGGRAGHLTAGRHAVQDLTKLPWGPCNTNSPKVLV